MMAEKISIALICLKVAIDVTVPLKKKSGVFVLVLENVLLLVFSTKNLVFSVTGVDFWDIVTRCALTCLSLNQMMGYATEDRISNLHHRELVPLLLTVGYGTQFRLPCRNNIITQPLLLLAELILLKARETLQILTTV